jgi:hypothetical protein
MDDQSVNARPTDGLWRNTGRTYAARFVAPGNGNWGTCGGGDGSCGGWFAGICGGGDGSDGLFVADICGGGKGSGDGCVADICGGGEGSWGGWVAGIWGGGDGCARQRLQVRAAAAKIRPRVFINEWDRFKVLSFTVPT